MGFDPFSIYAEPALLHRAASGNALGTIRPSDHFLPLPPNQEAAQRPDGLWLATGSSPPIPDVAPALISEQAAASEDVRERGQGKSVYEG